jgi:phosphoglycerol transferase MdoB-like AlkP superfamily enzyme
MYTWIFERAICPWSLDGWLFRFCLLRKPSLIPHLFIRLLGMLVGLFREKAGYSLRWRYLDKVPPQLVERFWKKRSKKLPALKAASGQVWLTRLPAAAVLPLAELADAKLYVGADWRELAREADVRAGQRFADAWPPCIRKDSKVTYVLGRRLIPTASEYICRRLLRGLYTFLILVFMGVGLGLMSLYFAAGSYKLDMVKTYFSVPLIPILNVIPVILLVFLLYLLFNRAHLAFFFSAFILLGFSFADYFKLSLRNDPLFFSDLAYASEGGGMAIARYGLALNWKMAAAICVCILGLLFAYFLVKARLHSGRLRCVGFILLCLVAVFGCRKVYFSQSVYEATANNVLVSYWSATGQFVSRGFVYPFLHSIKDAKRTVPEGYSPAAARELLEAYTDEDIPEGKKVHIVSLMLEAYNDFSKFGVPTLSDSVYGPMHELEARSYHGELITNIFAGGTVDTEWDFLTGFSSASDFRSNVNSYVRYLKEQGYYAEGGHPCYDWFYNRANVNRYLGFDNYYFYENKYGAIDGSIIKDDIFIPDIYEMLTEHLAKSDDPYFSFSVTYQNHGPYDAETYWYKTDPVVNEGYTDAEFNILRNYFAGVENTGKNVVELADKLDALDEPVVLIVFGDHNPWMGNDNSVYKRLGIDFDFRTTEGFCNYYCTPYLIYANAAAKEALDFDFVGEGPRISPCFLMNLFFRLAGLKGNRYMQLATDMMDASPLVHTYKLYWENGGVTEAPSVSLTEALRRFFIAQFYWRWTAPGK